jgi:hypothetical protein
MDQETLTKAIEGNFDSMKTILNWAIILSLTVLWAGVQRRKEVEAAGFKFDRSHAANFGAALYSFANIAIIIALTRILELLRLLMPARMMSALTSMLTDPWILNPISHITNDPLMVSINALGAGLWVLSWWLFFSSIISARDKNPQHVSVPLIVTFLVTSILAALLLLIFVVSVGVEAYRLDTELGKGFVFTSALRIVACVGGWLGGKWVFNHIESLAAAKSVTPDRHRPQHEYASHDDSEK